jgi:hypothetical protein
VHFKKAAGSSSLELANYTLAACPMMSEEEFIALAKSRYAELAALEQSKNFYEHEKKFDEIWIGLGQQVLEATVGAVPEQVRKKSSFKADTAKSK